MQKYLKCFWQYAAFLFLLVIAGCSTQPSDTAQSDASLLPAQQYSQKTQQLIALLQQEVPSKKALQGFSNQALNSQQAALLSLAKAKQLLATDKQQALALSQNVDVTIQIEDQDLQVLAYSTQADVLHANEQFLAEAKLRAFLAPSLTRQQEQYLGNQQKIWQALNTLSQQQLNQAQTKEQAGVFKQWLALNRIARFSELPLSLQIKALDHWQTEYSTHPAAMVPPEDIAAIRMAANYRPKHIAVMLPLDGKYAALGEAIQDGIMASFYKSEYQPRISFYSVDKNQDFLSFYQDVIAEGVDLVIGPIFKEHLESLYSLSALPVTTLALNKNDSEQTKPEGLFEFSLSPDDEILSLIEFANQQQYQRAVILRQSDSWAENGAALFTQQWQQQGKQVLANKAFTNNKQQSSVIQSALAIDASKDRIRKIKWAVGMDTQAEPRRRQDVDMILILSKPQLAASLRPLLSFHYASDIDLYATSSIYRGYPEPRIDNDLSRIRFTELPMLLGDKDRISKKYQRSGLVRMYAFGNDALQIAERLRLMQSLPSQGMYGATGSLYLEQQTLHREAAFAEFKRGKVVPLTLSQNNE